MYTITNTTQALGASLTDVIIKVINFLPSILIAILLVILGWVCGGILGRATAHLVSLLKIDQALQAAGITEVVNGVKFSVGKSLGAVVKWGLVIAFLMTATQVVHLDSFAGLLWVIISYIPNVIVAAMILISAILLADFVSKLVAGSAKAAGVSHHMASLGAKYTIVIVGVLAALSQLKIAGGFMSILFAGIVAALSIALGLAFGLGGRDAAARAIEKIEKSM